MKLIGRAAGAAQGGSRLHRVALGEEAVIELVSDTFVPAKVADSPDRRTLGVAVAGIWLESDL